MTNTRTLPESKLLRQLAKKNRDIEMLARKVAREPELVPELLEGLSSEFPSIKYGSDKTLRALSETNPEVLYEHIDFFIGNLDADNTILRWGATRIVGNLAPVDSKGAIEKSLDLFFAPIPGPALIGAANAIGSAADIALAKPKLSERVVKEILKVSRAKYKTPECRKVAIGIAIESFDRIFDQIEDKEPVVKFVKRQLKNTRASTAKKAERFLKKHVA